MCCPRLGLMLRARAVLQAGFCSQESEGAAAERLSRPAGMLGAGSWPWLAREVVGRRQHGWKTQGLLGA